MVIKVLKEKAALERKIRSLKKTIEVKDWNIENLKRQLKDLINRNRILMNENDRIEKQLHMMLEPESEMDKVAVAPTMPDIPVVKKKRGRPCKKKREDSDTEFPSPKQRCPWQPRYANTFAVPKDSPTLRKISSEEQEAARATRHDEADGDAEQGLQVPLETGGGGVHSSQRLSA